jgi:hypothetical protein
MNPTYDVQYFINKFEAIPKELWNADGSYVNKDNPECKCALGHCVFTDYSIGTRLEEGKALIAMIENCVTDINDGDDDRYQQPPPKQRVLAALNDVKNGVKV